VSVAGENFLKAFGAPAPPTPNGLAFPGRFENKVWLSLHDEVGSGWYQDGFLYLFGEGLESLRPCLDAWSFLLPPCDDRIILGRNAYGAILVMDNANDPDLSQINVLDPFTVSYGGPRNADFISTLVARVLPKQELRWFHDDGAYRAWMAEHGVRRLRFDDVLGIKVPRALGGELIPDNLQLDGIVEYYESTGPIYAKALAGLPRPQ
jgi:hypothetical protein